jgi:hypothetical protein
MSGLFWLKRSVAAALVVVMLSPAMAATIAESDCPKQPTRIIVLGDSLADGLWGSLYRTFSRCKSIETVRVTKVSDGLAKTSDAGWLQRYAEEKTRLDTKVSDIVVVQMGANDITTIRNGSSRESFDSSNWGNVYANRVASLTQGLKAKTADVFWFGLPIVGKSNLEGPYQTISSIQKAAVKRAGGTFIDIHDHTKFGTGNFAMNGSYQGRLQQLRAPDKVHFTKSGYDFVAQVVLDDLVRFTRERDRRAALKNVELQ